MEEKVEDKIEKYMLHENKLKGNKKEEDNLEAGELNKGKKLEEDNRGGLVPFQTVRISEVTLDPVKRRTS